MARKPRTPRKRQPHFFRKWREARFPNQADAMEALGWSQSKISRLENGETPYSQDDLELAAEVYGCSVADLLTRPPEAVEGPVASTEGIEALLRKIAGLSEQNIAVLLGVITGFQTTNAGSPSHSQSGDRSEPASRPHGSAPADKRVPQSSF